MDWIRWESTQKAVGLMHVTLSESLMDRVGAVEMKEASSRRYFESRMVDFMDKR